MRLRDGEESPLHNIPVLVSVVATGSLCPPALPQMLVLFPDAHMQGRSKHLIPEQGRTYSASLSCSGRGHHCDYCGVASPMKLQPASFGMFLCYMYILCVPRNHSHGTLGMHRVYYRCRSTYPSTQVHVMVIVPVGSSSTSPLSSHVIPVHPFSQVHLPLPSGTPLTQVTEEDKG